MIDRSIAPNEMVSERIYQDLMLGITYGDYPVNSQLPTELSLGRDYGVSRTVVRAALDLLKSDGFVESKQGSGTVVASKIRNAGKPNISAARQKELFDCYQCRLTLEPEIAACVANNITDEVEEYLEGQMTALDNALETSSSQNAADANFHVRLAEYSKNNFFMSIMNSLRPHILFSMNSIHTLSKIKRDAHIRQSKIEHRQVAELILGGSADEAMRAMKRHILNGRKRLFPNKNGTVKSST